MNHTIHMRRERGRERKGREGGIEQITATHFQCSSVDLTNKLITRITYKIKPGFVTNLSITVNQHNLEILACFFCC